MSNHSGIRFESSWKKAEERDKVRSARKRVLEHAEGKALKRVARKEKEESWMLPDLEAEFEKSDKKKKRKKEKKEKKEKKKKHKKEKKKRKKSSSSAESSASSDEWEEKPCPISVEERASESKSEEPLVRSDWMQMEGIINASSSRSDFKESRADQRTKERIERESEITAKQNKKELNPLITHQAGSFVVKDDVKLSSSSRVGDGGASWLKRAFSRAQEQAAREGRTIEDVATERWGSLKKFEQLLAKAEGLSEDKRGDHWRESGDRGRRSDSRGRDKYEDGREHNGRSRDYRRPVDGANQYRDEHKRLMSHSSGGWRKKSRGMPESLPVETRKRSPSSSSASEDEKDKQKSHERETNEPSEPSEKVVAVLSDKEMNALGAKIIKAEMLGNEELAKKLKLKLEEVRHAKANLPQHHVEDGKAREEVVVLTRTDSKGMARPVEAVANEGPIKGKRKKEKVDTHYKGERIRYFADDDRYSLKEMYEREKLSTAEDQNAMLSRLAGKSLNRERTDDDYDLDDAISDRAAAKRSEEADKRRDRDKAIMEHRRLNDKLDECKFCFGGKNFQKHLLIAVGKSCYLMLPHHTPITEGHCFIIPMSHISCGLLLDEDVFNEMQMFRKALTKMFENDDNQDCVFYESALRLRKQPHMLLECVPIPREIGNDAPMYFQKAIQECESEWSHNKKLVKLTNEKGLRRSVPKGLPYFHVDFGLQNGFAHVVEDEENFATNFAQEILGGMLDLDPRHWKNPKRDSFENQKSRVLKFGAKWKDVDFTRKKKSSSSSSDSD